MLVRERKRPLSSVRKAMLLLPPASCRPKYVFRKAWVAGTSVTVRLRWFNLMRGRLQVRGNPGDDGGRSGRALLLLVLGQPLVPPVDRAAEQLVLDDMDG